MFEKIREIIAEKLSIKEDDVTMESSFVDDLNADSLDLVELMMALEDELETEIPDEINFSKTLRDYGVKKCYYAHLHGESHKEALEGLVDDIEYKLVSSDYLKFNLLKIN